MNSASKRGFWSVTALGLLLVWPDGSATGQVERPDTRARDDRVPVLTSIFPPAVTVGGQTVWRVQGRNLKQITNLHVQGSGVRATVTKAEDRTALVDVRADDSAVPGFREVRAEAPGGVSNLRLIRVDRLPQVVEREPNDLPAQATELRTDFAAAGLLRPQDIDHYKFEAQGGTSMMIEVEARRLGSAIAPVMTVMTAGGRAVAQGRATPGIDDDCRIVFKVPEGGSYLVQVRDNLYGGSETATYRLRLTGEPFATGLFPLGGAAGQKVRVTASGGTLVGPLEQEIPLPDSPGLLVDLPPFEYQGAPVLAPGRLLVGDGAEVTEPVDVTGLSALQLNPGVTVNGRLDRPGEVDRYRLALSRRESDRIEITAARLGSRLDSVLTLRDARGQTVAENDDRPVTGRGPGTLTRAPNPDSRLDYRAGGGGELTVEVSDRFGRGGPEYAYRLEAGPPRTSFEVMVLPEQRRDRPATGRIGQSSGDADPGTFSLTPGSQVIVPFQVLHDARPVPVVVAARDLPPGVTSEAVTVRPPVGAMVRGGVAVVPGQIVLHGQPSAAAGLGWMRIVATADDGLGKVVTREAFADLTLDAPPGPVPRRPVVRRVRRFPVKLLERRGPDVSP